MVESRGKGSDILDWFRRPNQQSNHSIFFEQDLGLDVTPSENKHADTASSSSCRVIGLASRINRFG